MICQTARGLQYSVHECPKRFAAEVKAVFPNVDPSETRIIPTCQKTQLDMTNWGDDVAKEKNELLEKFSSWAEMICKALITQGYWADYIDPCSGLPMIDKSCTNTYNEVQGFSVLLQYKLFDAGGCKIVSHPEWGTQVYPATMFTSAPTEIVTKVIEDSYLQ